jgi:hypothetical protein
MCFRPSSVRSAADTRTVLREEIHRLTRWQERHRRLFSRLLLALVLTLGVDAIGALVMYALENGKGDIHGFGDAAFFSTVQLLTVSSGIKNPVTSGGKILDVALEVWAIFVITAIAGSFSAFFGSGDSSS